MAFISISLKISTSCCRIVFILLDRIYKIRMISFILFILSQFFVKQAIVFTDHTQMMICNQEKVQNFTRVLDDSFFL